MDFQRVPDIHVKYESKGDQYQRISKTIDRLSNICLQRPSKINIPVHFYFLPLLEIYP